MEIEREHCNRYQRRFLFHEITNKQKHLKQLNKHLDYETNMLNNKVTWMKGFAVTYSIDIVMKTYKSKVDAAYEKNLYMNN